MIAELVGPTTALWERQLAPTLVLGLTRVRATLDTAALAQRALVLFETLLLFFFFFFFSSSSSHSFSTIIAHSDQQLRGGRHQQLRCGNGKLHVHWSRHFQLCVQVKLFREWSHLHS